MTSGITFLVDDVTPVTRPLPALTPTKLSYVLGGPPLAMRVSEGELVSIAESTPGLIEAIHLAFAEHRRLVLTPDAIWLTIASGLAIHLRENTERVSARLVRHQGKKELIVDATNDVRWDDIVASFGSAITKETGPGLVNLFTTSFSTTTDVDRTASQILLMEAMKRHFSYGVRSICGIPTITLAGTPDDWRDIRRRVEVMSELELGWWTSMLLPLCDRFIETAEGRPDREFWKSIYKPKSAYGGDTVTGWVVRLYPYLGDKDPTPSDFAAIEPEGVLRQGDDGYWEDQMKRHKEFEQRRVDWREKGIFPTPRCAPDAFVHSPISPSFFPTGRTRVEVRMLRPDGESAVELVGGLIGVVQRENGLTVAPASGWAVRDCR
jgi:hypothetical protein